MAGEAKAPDNRLFQLVIVLITAVIGPLTVYFVTNSEKQDVLPPTPAVQATTVLSAETAMQTPQVVVVTATPETTLPAASVLEPGAPSATAFPPTPTTGPVANPSGIVPAGTIIQSGSLILLFDPGSIQTDGDYLRLALRLRNTGEQAVVLNYTLKAIKVKDDTGREYALYNGERGNACKKQEIDKKRTLTLNPGEEVTLQSPVRENAGWWCSADHAGALPLYTGPLHKDAKALMVQIENLGPFSGFTVRIER